MFLAWLWCAQPLIITMMLTFPLGCLSVISTHCTLLFCINTLTSLMIILQNVTDKNITDEAFVIRTKIEGKAVVVNVYNIVVIKN